MRPDSTPDRDLEAWREAWQADAEPSPAGCPADEELAALALDEPQGPERRHLADHVVHCPRCRSGYRTLRELHREASSARAGSRTRVWRRLLATAALVMAVAGVAWIGWLRGSWLGEPERTLRGSAEATLSTEPDQGARLPEPPGSLTWSRSESGTSERVVLYDEESLPLWVSDPTSTGRVTVPPEVRERLAGGGVFFWRIVPDEATLSHRGPLFRLEIRP